MADEEKKQPERNDHSQPASATNKKSPADVTDDASQKRTEQPVQPERAPLADEDGGSEQVTEKMNEDLSKGYHGHVPDETPNSAYTVQGVTSGAERPDAQDEPLSPDEKA